MVVFPNATCNIEILDLMLYMLKKKKKLFKLKIFLNATAVCIHSCYAPCMNIPFTAMNMYVYICAEAMMKYFLIFLLQKDVDIVNLAYK